MNANLKGQGAKHLPVNLNRGIGTRGIGTSLHPYPVGALNTHVRVKTDKSTSERRELPQSNQWTASHKAQNVEFGSRDSCILAEKTSTGLAQSVEHGHHKARLAELASARGFKLANSLGIETNADYEQDWLSIHLAYRNGVDHTVHQCARDAIR
jgi:hypothetical protein